MIFSCNPQRVLQGRNHLTPFCNKILLPRDDNILSLRQWMPDRFVRLASHNDRLSKRDRAEVLQILRNIPRNLPVIADHIVFRSGGNEGNAHGSTIRRRVGGAEGARIPAVSIDDSYCAPCPPHNGGNRTLQRCVDKASVQTYTLSRLTIRTVY